MIRVIRHHASAGVLPLLLSEVLLLSSCFWVSAEILYPPSGWYYLLLEGGAVKTGIAVATIILAMYFFDMYSDVQVASRIVLLQQLCQSMGVAILAQTVADYIFRDWTVPEAMMLLTTGFALITLFCWRLLFSALMRKVGVQDNLLFLGRNETADAVARAIEENPKAGYQVIGFLDDQNNAEENNGDQNDRRPVLGGLDSLRAVVAKYRPSLLVVGLAERRDVLPIADLVALRFEGLRIEEAGTTFENVYQRVRLTELSEQQVIFARSFLPRTPVLQASRLTSLILASTCGFLLLPLILVIALWLRMRSSGPVLLRLPRAGKDGRRFQMLRFRRDPSLLPLFQRFQLDALPELANVLRGEMSLVGPYAESPERVEELSQTLPFYEYRTAVPPGMTGWAQINLSQENRANRELALEYDLYYIKHMSQALNLYILAHSLKNKILRP